MRVSWLGSFVLLLAAARPGLARTISIAPGDDYTKMEAAVAGDVVEIAPGTYKFRVNFTADGTPSAPITVRAQDPANRPVWDLTGTPVSSAPGSSNAGDKGRGCWQFRGANYRVDGIVFRNCTDSSSAGLRVVNVAGIEVRNSRFVGNTNGLTGAGDGLTIEFCEFDGNGHVFAPGDNLAHQIYIFGGTLAVRYSYFHDSPEGQAFHVRARDAVLEYNWITRPGSYLGDLMSCEYLCGGSGAGGVTQSMLLRGNVLVQSTPANHGQLLVMYKDGGASSDATGDVNAMQLTLVHNTIVGTAGYNNVVVHHRNDSGISTSAHLYDNVVTDFKQLDLVEAPGTANFVIDGGHNWLSTGTDDAGVAGSVFGGDPMLGAGYVPAATSPVVGQALAVAGLTPSYEYYRDEALPLMGRARATAHDIGAFESTTASSPFDGHGNAPPPPDLGSAPASDDAGAAPDGGGDNGHPASGCGCDLGGAVPTAAWWPLGALLFVACARRRAK